MPNLITPQVSYPGVYVVEVPEGPPAVAGVPTSVTAFLGRTLIGLTNTPTMVTSFGQFEALFGGLSEDYPLSYSVRDFFNNGGMQAIIVRLFHSDPLPPIDPWKAAGGAAALGWLVVEIKQAVDKGTSIGTKIAAADFVTKTLGLTLPSGAASSNFTQSAGAVGAAVKTAIGTMTGTGEALEPAYGAGVLAWLNFILGTTSTNALKGTLSDATLGELLDDALLVYEALQVTPAPTLPPPLVGEPSFALDLSAAVAELAGGAAACGLFGVPSGMTGVDPTQLQSVEGAAQVLAAMWALTTNPLSNPTPGQLQAAAAAQYAQVSGGYQRLGAGTIVASATTAAGAGGATANGVLSAVLQTFTTDPTLLGKPASKGAPADGGPTKAAPAPFNNLQGLYLGMAGVNALAGLGTAAGVVLLTGPLGFGLALAKAIDTAQPGSGTDKTPAQTAMALVNHDIATYQTAQDVLDHLLSASSLQQAPLVQLVASGPGAWGNDLTVAVSPSTANAPTLQSMGYQLQQGDLFDITVTYQPPGAAPTSESFNNVTLMAGTPYTVDTVVNGTSQFIRVKTAQTWTTRPQDPGAIAPDESSAAYFVNGVDGGNLTVADYLGDPTQKTGLYALTDVDIFNLLCIPPDVRIDLTNTVTGMDTSPLVYQAAMAYCTARRAILLMDPPCGWYKQAKLGNLATAVSTYIGQIGGGNEARNAALYFPHLLEADPSQNELVCTFAPSGAIAGVIAQTDASRGVWKAPAGTTATLEQISGLQLNVTDDLNGQVNLLGLNCLRTFSLYGPVVWGDRTLRGNAQLGDEYCYLSVRRLALYIEESLKRATMWAVFEPNAQPLWTAISGQVTSFMNQLKTQGAFYAFTVQCDETTTTQAEIDQGVVKVLIQFKPVKPAEFVVLYFQQTAGAAPST